jgi:glycosyltransferase involved in cell wall biosynthesis
MRILYATHLFLPKFYGGTEVYTFNIASEMRRRGHEVHVLACESLKTGQRNEVQSSNDVFRDLQVHRISLNIMLMDDPVRAEYFNPYVEEHLVEYFQHLRPDVIHAHHLSYLSTAVITAAQKVGIPTVFTATDFWLICPDSQLVRWNSSLCEGPTNIADCLRCYTHLSNRARKYRWILETLPDSMLNWLMEASTKPSTKSIWQFRALSAARSRAEWNRRIFNSIGMFIAPSKFLEAMFVRNGLTNPRRMQLPFGVLPQMLDSKWQKRPSEITRFGFIGTISKHKGVHVLIDAFRGVPASGRATLKVYGDLEFDPPYGRKIKRMAHGDGRIRFEGTFPHEQMNEILRGIDVLVVPSTWYENTPLVIYSALATRTPVICTNLGGMAEVVIDGKNGLTFEVGNVVELRQCLVRALNQDLRERLLPDRTAIASIGQNVDVLEQTYQKLLLLEYQHSASACAATP